jgi:hypothetical protein
LSRKKKNIRRTNSIRVRFISHPPTQERFHLSTLFLMGF